MKILSINTVACDGSDVFWPWLLWLLGAFLLGLLLGWLLKQLFGGGSSEGGSDWEAKYLAVKADLDDCRKARADLSAAAMAGGAGAAGASSFAAAAAPTVKDDLKKIEGIGPKIQDLLNNDGIYSFADLAHAAISRLQRILDDAGPAYTVHNPKTWPDQAKLAAEGRWDELEKWQDELKGGL